MKNVTMQVTKNVLTVTVDLTKTCGPSKSGKTQIIATTEGNVPLEGVEGAVIGLNVYRRSV